MSDIAFVLGRVAVSLIFVVSGLFKFMNIAPLAKHAGVAKFLAITGTPDFALGLAYLIAAVELVGGLMILVGFRAGFAALVLCLFTASTIYFGHPFWEVPEVRVAAERTQALKNLAIMGGLLLIAATGSGPMSVDRRTSSS